MVSLFEDMGSTYTLSADEMYCPGLELLGKTPLSCKYDRICYTYLHNIKIIYYTTPPFYGKLGTNFNGINDTANSRMELIIKKIRPVQTVKAP